MDTLRTQNKTLKALHGDSNLEPPGCEPYAPSRRFVKQVVIKCDISIATDTAESASGTGRYLRPLYPLRDGAAES